MNNENGLEIENPFLKELGLCESNKTKLVSVNELDISKFFTKFEVLVSMPNFICDLLHGNDRNRGFLLPLHKTFTPEACFESLIFHGTSSPGYYPTVSLCVPPTPRSYLCLALCYRPRKQFPIAGLHPPSLSALCPASCATQTMMNLYCSRA